ncbi:hypothetical protein PACTADRAFT_50584 [Pachysolen tannophilus NRRL Y-2460]|uniref:tRNA wybutosine-synthesizing protein 3 n=1 Tax=Pachysolen tannophilus NRRL Y-2460 TaxID=669874 RepID=A0A1E4TSJ1_PACTA|nr:hypothetical protein PACTADRAFT_50584 [Pachysolen tannophilus NRRL Y-2460]
MQDLFEQKKTQILKDMESTSLESPDLSPKGTIDELCIPIMNLINSNKDMVTTSSCSGRVSVFLEGSKYNNVNDDDKVKNEGVKIGAKGNGGHWLFVTHNPFELKNWWKDKNFLINNNDQFLNINETTRYILYKFEPFILHVKCRDLKMAQKLYTIAMNCGFRESGIGVNNLVAIRTSIRLDIPIGFLQETTENLYLLVTEQYLELITNLSLDRFKENKKRLNSLYNSISKMLEKNDQEIEQEHLQETKEQRRARKIKEGLARKEQVRKLKENIESI